MISGQNTWNANRRGTSRDPSAKGLRPISKRAEGTDEVNALQDFPVLDFVRKWDGRPQFWEK